MWWSASSWRLPPSTAVFPLFGFHASLPQHGAIAAAFTLTLRNAFRPAQALTLRGRKPKPAQLRVIEGGNDDGRGAACTGPKAPTCPAHLNPSAKAEWKRLAQQLFVRGIIGEGDRAALAAYCQAYGRWVQAERKLAETPLLIKLPSGYIQQSPWLAMANKQLEIMHKYMAELGLSPVSRSRVSIKRTPGPKPWEFGLSASRPADAYLKPRR